LAKGLTAILNVENLDKSIEFYKLLSLKAKKETQMDMTFGTITITPDTSILLWDRHNIGPNQDQADLRAWLSGDLGKGVMLTIGVPNAQRVWDNVSNMVPIDAPLREEPWGGKSFNVVDPDGYVINLTDKFPSAPKPTRKAKAAVKRTVGRTVSKAKRVVAKAKPAKAKPAKGKGARKGK
jgi:hypothetical protein